LIPSASASQHSLLPSLSFNSIGIAPSIELRYAVYSLVYLLCTDHYVRTDVSGALHDHRPNITIYINPRTSFARCTYVRRSRDGIIVQGPAHPLSTIKSSSSNLLVAVRRSACVCSLFGYRLSLFVWLICPWNSQICFAYSLFLLQSLSTCLQN
jgi:hypothetical protein